MSMWYVPPGDLDDIVMTAPLLVTEQAGLMSADAQTILARALGASVVQLNQKALAEAAFLIMYAGDWGAELVRFAFAHKQHQAPFAMGKLEKALQSLALKEFMSKVNINLGGK